MYNVARQNFDVWFFDAQHEQLCLESRMSLQRPKLFSRGFVFSYRRSTASAPFNDGPGQNSSAARPWEYDFEWESPPRIGGGMGVSVQQQD